MIVGVTNVAAWTGCGMRAEISAASGHVTAMTRYATVVIGTEAVGAMAAAFVPIRASGEIAGWLLVVAAVVYGVVLVPTYLVAFGSRVGRRMPTANRADTARRRRGPLTLGAAVMVMCPGPRPVRRPERACTAGCPSWRRGELLAGVAAPAVARRAATAPAVNGRVAGLGHRMVIGWALAP